MVTKLELRNFGEFLLKYLNVAVNINDINWNEVSEALDKYQTDQLITIKETTLPLFRPSLKDINEVVSEYYEFNPKVVRFSKSRKRELTKSRQVAHYIAGKVFKISDETIGEYYSKDRCTIIHSKKTVSNEIDVNKIYKIEIMTIINKLKHGSNNKGTGTERSIGEIQKAS